MTILVRHLPAVRLPGARPVFRLLPICAATLALLGTGIANVAAADTVDPAANPPLLLAASTITETVSSPRRPGSAAAAPSATPLPPAAAGASAATDGDGAGAAAIDESGEPLTEASDAGQGADPALVAAFAKARKAMVDGNLERFDQAVDPIPKGHPLYRYVEYWRLRILLSERRPESLNGEADPAVRNFIARYPESLVADLLRRDWMLALGRREDWRGFDEQYPRWILRDETAPDCYAQLSRLAAGKPDRAAASALVLRPVALNRPCRALYGALVDRGLLDRNRQRERLLLALEANSPNDIRDAASRPGVGADANLVDQALRRPAQTLKRNGLPPDVALIALTRLIRSDADEGAKRIDAVAPRLGATERSFVWSQMAAAGARRMMPEAYGWMVKAHPTTNATAPYSDDTRRWLVRAALRQQDWRWVGRLIDGFSADVRAEPEYRYWRGRAHAGAGAPTKARAEYEAIAPRLDYYGKLAREELGRPIPLLPRAPDVLAAAARSGQQGSNSQPGQSARKGSADTSPTRNGNPPVTIARVESGSATDVATRADARTDNHADSRPDPRPDPRPDTRVADGESALQIPWERNEAIQRARAFYDVGLRFEGNREWNFAMRSMTPAQIRSVAWWAQQQGLLDRAINTDERLGTDAVAELRFPTPHAEALVPIAQANGIDPSWAYGLIRQESRFIPTARSSVGASGLMQLMPATARWVARQLGRQDYGQHQIDDLKTNLEFGTFYLKRVLDNVDGSPLLASAGYNAGPRRARDWRASLEQPLEGAIFAELIPFTETRNYVKHVLSNTVDYAALASGKPQSLKRWLGQVSPASNEAVAMP